MEAVVQSEGISWHKLGQGAERRAWVVQEPRAGVLRYAKELRSAGWTVDEVRPDGLVLHLILEGVGRGDVPDVVILEDRGDGLGLVEDLRSRGLRMPVLLVSDRSDRGSLGRAARAGACRVVACATAERRLCQAVLELLD